MDIKATVDLILSKEVLRLNDIRTGYEILGAYVNHTNPTEGRSDPEFYMANMFATAYKAGEIEGIRKERQRRNRA